ncbi:hypothetical protein ACFQUU_26965 [Herbaspirillum sp. GCM10030257]|uniref:hypothetical protein n=1 Tax=Herbaspirillum sp. GCM10030257 TaxID=3273393 RepID=UPI003623A50B
MFAIVPTLFFITAIAWNLVSVNWRSDPASYLLGSSMIACPFAVLAISHLTIANGRRSHAFLLSGNLLVAVAVYFVSFLMRWFQPGWIGIAFFSVLLLCLGAIWAVGGLAFRDKHNGPDLKLDTDVHTPRSA